MVDPRASADCLVWATAIVRASEDAGQVGTFAHEKAIAMLNDVQFFAKNPTVYGRSWLLCDVPDYLGWAAQAERCGRPMSARIYEACIAVKRLAAEVVRG